MRNELGLLFLIVLLCSPSTSFARASKQLKDCPSRYVVNSGDTLGGIAEATGHTVKELRTVNRLKDTRIFVEQKLRLVRCPSRARKATPSKALQGARKFLVKHRVRKGDSIGRIAKRYGATLKSIKRLNRLRTDRLRIGAQLKVPVRMGTDRSTVFEYTIRPGDTLSGIAEKFRVKWTDISRLNGNVAADRLFIGSKIRILVEGPIVRSKAMGKPYQGRLVNGEQLGAGPGYYRRRPHRSWGTNETIGHILRAIQGVRKRFPGIHDLAIGDISKKRGGKLHPHVSHQSGRDVDLGFYFKGQPPEGPKRFISALHNRFDYRANWALLNNLIGPSKKRSPVRVIFLSYSVQERLYKWAKKRGVSQKKLDWLFQYPRGNRALRGMIRHSPGHWAHIHVRFKCPVGMEGCRG